MKRCLALLTPILIALAGCEHNSPIAVEDASVPAPDAACARACDCCAQGEVCFEDACCKPACDGKRCGSDGCGGSCGACEPGWTCGASGQCECPNESDAALCQRLGLECGPATATDLCGQSRTVECGGCQPYSLCDATNTCTACTAMGDAELCADLGMQCGAATAVDACSQQSRALECGGCAPGTLCNAATNACEPCTSESDTAYCDRALGQDHCGTVTGTDNCNLARTFDCGTCAAPRFCDATSHCHACIPETTAQFCARAQVACGPLTAPDNCGDMRTVTECGPCAATDRCQAGACVLCTAETAAQLCAAWYRTCGTFTVTDSCGDARTVADCGACSSGLSCQTTGVCSNGLHPTNDTCASPIRLAFDAQGLATVTGDTSAATNNDAGSCGGSGNDLVYVFTLPATSDVTVEVDAAAFRPIAYLRSTCDVAGSELACGAATAENVPAMLGARALPAGTYFVAVDAEINKRGAFSLTLRATAPVAPPANDLCAGATPLAFQNGIATAVGDTTGATNDSKGSCSAMTGGDVVFSFTLTSSAAVRVRAARASAAFAPAVYLRSSCASAAATDEIDCALPRTDPAAAIATELAPGTYYVIVDGLTGSFGPFTLEVAQLPPVLHDTCAAPKEIALDASGHGLATGDTLVAHHDAAGTCAATATSRDLVYAFTVPAGSPMNAVVSVTAPSASTFLPMAWVRSTCDVAANELACTTGSISAGATLALTRLAPGTYYVWVEGLGDTTGTFTLDVALSAPAAPPANDSCSAPTALAIVGHGTAHETGTTVGAANDSAGGCSAGTALHNGGDVVYSFNLRATSSVSVRVARDAASTSFVPAVYLRSACADPATQVTCDTGLTGDATASATNMAAGLYYVIVDGVGNTAGGFTLDLTIFDPMTNDSCSSPRALSFDAAGTAIARTDTCMASDGTSMLDTCGGAGPDVVYSMTLAAASDVTATLLPGHSGTSWLYLRSDCASRSDLRCNSVGGGGTNRVSLRGLAAGTYYWVVDSGATSSCGVFDLTVTATPALPFAANDSCAAAQALTVDAATHTATVTATTEDGTNDGDPSCRAGSGPDLFYRLDLAQAQAVTITATPASGSSLRPVIALRPSCAAADGELACVARTSSTPAVISIPRVEAGTYYVVVDASDVNHSGPFQLQVALAPVAVTAPNDACANAIPLTIDSATNRATVTGDSGTGLNDYRSGCSWSGAPLSGPDLVYSFQLQLPALVTARATRDPSNTVYRPAVSIRASCAATTDLACALDDGAGSSSTAVALQAGTYYVFVDGITSTVSGSGYGPFTLEVSTGALPTAGGGCGAVVPLTFDATGVANATGSTTNAIATAAPTCLSGTTTNDVVYSFTLAADAAVTVTLANAGGTSDLFPSLYVRSTCDSPLTEVGCMTKFAAQTATLTFPRLAAGTWYVWVDSYGGHTGDYTLAVATTAPTGTAPANDLCAGATPLALDATTHGAIVEVDLTNASPDYSGSCGDSMYPLSGPDVVYSLTLAQPATVRAVLARESTASSVGGGLYLRSNCTSDAAADELACAAAASASLGGSASFTRALAAGTYYLIVDSQRSRSGKFRLEVTTSTATALPDACASAEAIPLNAAGEGFVAGDTSAASDDALGSCVTTTASPDLVYSVTLPAAKNLTVDLLVGGTLRPKLYLRAACADGATEKACAASTSSADLQIFAPALPAGTYYLWVDGAGTAAAGMFALHVTTSDVVGTANDTCRGAQSLTLDGNGYASVTGNTTDGRNDYVASCATASAPFDGPDLVFSFTLPERRLVTAKVTRDTAATTYKPTVYLRSTCASPLATAEVACATNSTATSTATTTLPAGTYYAFVDGASKTAGAFTLEVTTTPTGAMVSDTCLDAVPLVFDAVTGIAPLSGTTAGAGNSGDGSCRTGSGGDVVFSFALAQPSTVDIAVAPVSGSTLRPTFYVRSECGNPGPSKQLICASATSAAAVSGKIGRLAAGTYYLWVDTYTTYSGAFTGTVTAQPAPPPPLNDTCAGATPLVFTSGTATVTGDETTYATDDATGSCATGAALDRVYSMTLASDQKVVATVARDATTASYQPLVYIRSVCNQSSESAELTCARASSGTATATINTLPAGTYWIWVDGSVSAGADTPAGKYTLTVTLSTPVAPVAGENCSSPSPLTLVGNTVTVSGNTTTAQDESWNACWTSPIAADQVYSLTLASAQKVTATLVTTGTLPAAVDIRRTCSSNASSSLQICGHNTSAASTVTVMAPSLPAGTYFIWVDSPTAAKSGTYNLTVTTDVPATAPANDTCAGAIALTPSVSTAGDTTNASGDYLDFPWSDTCMVQAGSYFPRGPDVVYSYAPALSGSFTVTVVPASNYYPFLFVTDTVCGVGSACVAALPATGSGKTVSVTVDGVSGHTYFIIVDAPNTSATATSRAGTFTILVE